MSHIRVHELKYAIRLTKDGKTINQIKFILESCKIPKEEAAHLALLSKRIHNKNKKECGKNGIQY